MVVKVVHLLILSKIFREKKLKSLNATKFTRNPLLKLHNNIHRIAGDDF